MTAKPVSSSHTTMSELMQPNDANFLGKVFGGRLLSLIDLCAYTTASRFAGTVTVTASFDRVDFHEPIEVAEVVTMEGFVSYVGRTSIEVTIEVFAEDILAGTKRHTNTARVTMVALKDGRPTEVPRLLCTSREEKIRYLEGRLRRELRKRQIEERDRLFALYRESSDEELDRLLAQESIPIPTA